MLKIHVTNYMQDNKRILFACWLSFFLWDKQTNQINTKFFQNIFLQTNTDKCFAYENSKTENLE